MISKRKLRAVDHRCSVRATATADSDLKGGRIGQWDDGTRVNVWINSRPKCNDATAMLFQAVGSAHIRSRPRPEKEEQQQIYRQDVY